MSYFRSSSRVGADQPLLGEKVTASTVYAFGFISLKLTSASPVRLIAM
jgi:hypothetical protein